MAGGTEYHVGICQLVQHVALDAATKGFEDKLKTTAVGGNGDTVVFDEQNAAGSSPCSTICNTFVSDGVDLILANATPALQAAQASTNEIPILETVTDYAHRASRSPTGRGRPVQISPAPVTFRRLISRQLCLPNFCRTPRTSVSFIVRLRQTPSISRMLSRRFLRRRFHGKRVYLRRF